MDTININFNGDMHISLSPDSARQLRDGGVPKNVTGDYRALVKAIGDFLFETADEKAEYENGADDEDIDSIVVVLYPGKAPQVMTESESYYAVEQHGDFGSVLTINDPDICAYDLKAAYDARTVLRLGDERYLIGPAIVYASDENGDSISLDAEDVMAAIVYFSEHTVMLCADGKDLPSFAISGKEANAHGKN